MESWNLLRLQEFIKSFDYNPEKAHVYMLKLMEEVGELAEAVRKKSHMKNDEIKGTIDEELVDVLYYTVALANIHGVDLDHAFELKERLNKVKWGR